MVKDFLRITQKGFTIIEVMIVLAIAGLILIVVLIAVPQLQRSQRNNSRQNIVARISTELGNYAGNNNGSLPAESTANASGNFGGSVADTQTFLGKYLNGININDPSTGTSVTFAVGTPATAPTQGQIKYFLSAECGSDGVIVALVPSQNRKYALAIGLEGGRVHCLHNK
jgi:prepilin-type N-terminal cleavage/methylation domain-containing protein